MTFLALWAAWFLAGVPVIVLLYLLKLKRRPLPVSTLMFWQRVLQESRRRALFQRLRNLLSLLLHLLIFLLILAALAKPTFDRFLAAGSSTVLILDTRARMQAIEKNGASRFEIARQLASAYCRQTSSQSQFALLTAGASPTVVAPFSDDEKLLQKALTAVSVTDSTGDLTPAIRLAEQLLRSRKGDARILILTDRSPPEFKSQKSKVKIDSRPVGTVHDNVAITRFATRPLLNSPDTSEVLLEVRNFGNAVANGTVELSFDGRPLDAKPFAIEPGGRLLNIFPSLPRTTRHARGWLTARLTTPDALAFDNVAYAVLPTAKPHRVLLVTKGNWFLEKLLAADRQITFELLDPSAFQIAMAAKFDAVILDHALPPNFDLDQTPGNFLFIHDSPFTAPSAPIEQPLVSDIDAANPLLRLVSLQNVTIVRAAPVQLPATMPGWKFTAPLRSFDHPLLINGTAENGKQRVAVLAFDIGESDLPLRIAFPLLIANTVHWLAGEEAAPPLTVRVGETLSLTSDQTLSTEPQTDFNATPKADPPRLARTVFQPQRQGFYQLNQPAGSTWLAVDTFSEAESDLRGADSPSPQSARLSDQSFAALTARPLWQYLALAALILTTLEWWLFHRRRTE